MQSSGHSYLSGAVIGGVVFDRTHNPAKLIALATVSVAVGVALVPTQSTVVALGLVTSFQVGPAADAQSLPLAYPNPHARAPCCRRIPLATHTAGPLGVPRPSLTLAPARFASLLCAGWSTSGAQGIGMGLLDTGGNVMLIKIWGESVGPYMQLMHCLFGVGAFASPLIARNFIADAPAAEAQPPGNSTEAFGSDLGSGTSAASDFGGLVAMARPQNLTTAAGRVVVEDEGSVEWAFYVSAMLMLPAISMWAWLASRRPAMRPPGWGIVGACVRFASVGATVHQPVLQGSDIHTASTRPFAHAQQQHPCYSLFFCQTVAPLLARLLEPELTADHTDIAARCCGHHPPHALLRPRHCRPAPSRAKASTTTLSARRLAQAAVNTHSKSRQLLATIRVSGFC